MRRRVRLVSFICLVVVAAFAAVMWFARRHRIRNVVIISVDDLRADRLSLYGNSRGTSPNIDALGAESAVFTDAVTQFTSTLHSHRSLFSGRYPFRAGKVRSLAEVLNTHGFETAAFTGGGYMDRRFGFSAGFEIFEDRDSYSGLKLSLPRVEKWLRERDTNRPFFLFLHTYDVHCPFAPPEPYRSMFLEGRAIGFEIEGKCENNYFNKISMSDDDFTVLRSLYDGGVRWTDEMLGGFLQRLRETGLLDDTLVVLLSDHGERLGEHGDVGHGSVFDEEQRVPLVVRAPGGVPRQIPYPAQLVDVFPTVLSALGIDQPHSSDGVDLMPVLYGNSAVPQARVRFTESVRGHRTLRFGDRWKLVRRKHKRDAELYDLRLDADQNVADRHRTIVDLLVGELEQLTAGGRTDEPGRQADALERDLRERLRALGYLD